MKKRTMMYMGAGRAYLDPSKRGASHPRGVIEALFKTKFPDLENEAVGFLLFGKELVKLRERWDAAVSDERHGRFALAAQQYSHIADRVLDEDYLTPQSHIAAWLPWTKDGKAQSQGAVWMYLKRARQRVEVRSNRELQGLALKALHDLAEKMMDRARAESARSLKDAVSPNVHGDLWYGAWQVVDEALFN